MSDYKRKRINLGVKKYFQKWLLIRILGMIIFSSIIAALILYFYARQEITSSFFDAHIKIRRVSDLLLPVVAAGSMVSLISGIILSLFLPQKIAGPIFRIEQGLKPIQDGDFTSLISLRKDDVLKDLAGEVNKATTETRVRVQKSKNALAALIEAMGSTAADSAVQDRIKDLEKSLAQFKTK
ncbi:MAG: methyl-accepting chemotaxis protein [Proteobacteria bacterium]|nr:methyl-accepting chemotaxis protein [Pseudomonadota bacterium]MBU1233206.1 methyl-accepting chemotaxis protein [Pseudomonadota bacterium]MBU1418311.1 methyl-accepting chemotaxis protein [Pseudomonadota bacterium]MBU1455389.1 methyl-accepting chemotaxis protein [Pseudomonadota bacterium]